MFSHWPCSQTCLQTKIATSELGGSAPHSASTPPNWENISLPLMEVEAFSRLGHAEGRKVRSFDLDPREIEPVCGARAEPGTLCNA